MSEALPIGFDINPFEEPRHWRRLIRENVRLSPNLEFDGKGFICALVNSRCPVGCEHCMFGSNMAEDKNPANTMTETRVSNLLELVQDSNTGYLLVSGGGEGFLEPDRMYQIVEGTTADVTWMVTGGHWAKDESRARRVVEKMYRAFEKGRHDEYDREICLRISLDSYHVEKIGRAGDNRLQYVENLVRLFESEYADEENFVLQIHSIEGEEELVEELRNNIGGEKLNRYDAIHDEVKVTENAYTIQMDSGYEFEVTFAKLLYSDMAANLNNKDLLEKRIEVFEKDAYENERGRPAIKQNADGSIGPNMLVVYDGRVAFWQSEMPDVPLDIDRDDFDDIMEKSLTDPGVLGTIENGLEYRYDIVKEVCPEAVLRSKAVNVRDYTSPVLLQEDKIKLYYSVRVLQDFVTKSRIDEEDIENWPPGIRTMVRLSKPKLQELYYQSDYDIIQQFIEGEDGKKFEEFVKTIKEYTRSGDSRLILEFFESRPDIGLRTVDEWRLLLERINGGWYKIETFDDAELAAIGDVEAIMDEDVLQGQRLYEGLSAR